MVAIQVKGHGRTKAGTSCRCGKRCRDEQELAEHLTDAHRRHLQPQDVELTDGAK